MFIGLVTGPFGAVAGGPRRRRDSTVPIGVPSARRAGPPSAEFRRYTFLADAVEVEVDLLVVEAAEPGDLLAFRQRRAVDPHDVGVDRLPGVHGPVACRAL